LSRDQALKTRDGLGLVTLAGFAPCAIIPAVMRVVAIPWPASFPAASRGHRRDSQIRAPPPDTIGREG